jgi:hypothetical protein
LRIVTDAPPPDDPRDALIREQAVLEAMVADLGEQLAAAGVARGRGRSASDD